MRKALAFFLLFPGHQCLQSQSPSCHDDVASAQGAGLYLQLQVMAAPSNVLRILCRAPANAHLLFTWCSGAEVRCRKPAHVPELCSISASCLSFPEDFLRYHEKCRFLMSTEDCYDFEERVTSQVSGERSLVSLQRGKQESEGMSDSPAIRPEEERSPWALLQSHSSENPRREKEQ